MLLMVIVLLVVMLSAVTRPGRAAAWQNGDGRVCRGRLEAGKDTMKG